MTSISNTSFARRLVVKGLMAGALLAAAISLPAAGAVDVSGYKFDDTAKVAGKDLKLNGAGMRTKLSSRSMPPACTCRKRRTTRPRS